MNLQSVRNQSGPTTQNCRGHRCINQYETYAGMIQKVLVKGASVLYSNITATNYDNGQIAAVQVSNGTDWTNFCNFDKVSSIQESRLTPIKTGMYAFLKPADDSEVRFQTNTRSYNGYVVDSFWPIDQMGSYLVMVATVADQANQKGKWTYNWSLEFTTYSIWFDAELAKGTVKDIEEAYQMVKNMPFAHENPKHLAEIKKIIAMGLKRYGPKVGKYAMNQAINYLAPGL